MAEGDEWTLATMRQFIEAVADERWRAHTSVHAHEGRALDLQAKELARRLDVLNHAHEEARRKEATFVPREAFEASQLDVTKRAELLATEVARRAEALNTGQQVYLPREVFDAYTKEQVARDERNSREAQVQATRFSDQLSVIYNDISSMKGRSAAYTVAIGVFFTIVTIAVSVLSRVIR